MWKEADKVAAKKYAEQIAKKLLPKADNVI